ncbi:MAG TPA: phenylacetate--CoA ligase family protein, partial [Bacillota bacterium]|nr:phenylacetate--CoA ligase family protein [Bacillota bacterium]
MNCQSKTLSLLNRLISRCRTAPFYRERLPEKPLGSLEEFQQIPLITKEDLRNNSPWGLLC